MNDKVLDPEAAMKRDAAKRRVMATRTSEVVMDAFIKEYQDSFNKKPDLSNPMMNMFYNAWVAAQGDRKWLTPEEIQADKKRQILNEKRRQTLARNGVKRRGSR